MPIRRVHAETVEALETAVSDVERTGTVATVVRFHGDEFVIVYTPRSGYWETR